MVKASEFAVEGSALEFLPETPPGGRGFGFDFFTTSQVWELGTVEYREAWQLQRRLHRERVEGKIPDLLLLLEHPPTITIGRSGTLDNVLVSKEMLCRRKISLFFIDRGGDVTYHGPGQLVGYPIIDLKERGRDLHRYVRNLEEVMQRALRDFSADAERDPSHPGLWVGGEEIAAIGLSVKRGVTLHGFSINVNTDLDPFSFINPCGYADRRATSMSRTLGRHVSTVQVASSLVSHFCDVFHFSRDGTIDVRALKNSITREGG